MTEQTNDEQMKQLLTQGIIEAIKLNADGADDFPFARVIENAASAVEQLHELSPSDSTEKILGMIYYGRILNEIIKLGKLYEGLEINIKHTFSSDWDPSNSKITFDL